jgi:diaminopimelate epimerase
MQVEFWKYHGTGNDFIMVDERGRQYGLSPEQIQSLCNRRTGVGADGMILLRESSEADFRMVYFNADGYEGSMCGNGGRCTTFFFDYLSGPVDSCKFITSDGIHEARIERLSDEDLALVTISLNDVSSVRKVLNGYFLDTGSPHYVEPVQKIELLDVVRKGRKLRHSRKFAPDGANINYLEVQHGRIYLRTYERGVEDETLSCGTGVTAAAIVYHELNGFHSDPVKIHTRGGNLEVQMDQSGNTYTNIWLKGPAKKVFKGYVSL